MNDITEFRSCSMSDGISPTSILRKACRYVGYMSIPSYMTQVKIADITISGSESYDTKCFTQTPSLLALNFSVRRAGDGVVT